MHVIPCKSQQFTDCQPLSSFQKQTDDGNLDISPGSWPTSWQQKQRKNVEMNSSIQINFPCGGESM